MNYEVIDDFLPYDYFIKLHDIVTANTTPWYWQPFLNPEQSDYISYFTHTVYNHNKINSLLYDDFKPLLDALNVKELIRCKLNCYLHSDVLQYHGMHADYEYQHKGCLFYFNTCDGYTILEDGTKIESISNRALLFDPSTLHQSTNTTNKKARFNVNINYF